MPFPPELDSLSVQRLYRDLLRPLREEDACNGLRSFRTSGGERELALLEDFIRDP